MRSVSHDGTNSWAKRRGCRGNRGKPAAYGGGRTHVHVLSPLGLTSDSAKERKADRFRLPPVVAEICGRSRLPSTLVCVLLARRHRMVSGHYGCFGYAGPGNCFSRSVGPHPKMQPLVSSSYRRLTTDSGRERQRRPFSRQAAGSYGVTVASAFLTPVTTAMSPTARAVVPLIVTPVA